MSDHLATILFLLAVCVAMWVFLGTKTGKRFAAWLKDRDWRD